MKIILIFSTVIIFVWNIKGYSINTMDISNNTKPICLETTFNLLQLNKSITLVSLATYNAIIETELFRQIEINNAPILFYNWKSSVHFTIAPLDVKTVILSANGIPETKQFFTNWRQSLYFKHSCIYVIFFFGDVIEINEVAAATWIVYAVRVLILDKDFNIYVLNEYSPTNCQLTNVRQLQSCNDYKTITDVITKTYKTFHGCPVWAMANKGVEPFIVDVKSPTYRGLEPLILEEMSKILNFSMFYLDHNFTNDMPLLEKVPCCMYTNMLEKKADLMIGMIYAVMNVTKYFDVSRVYLPSQLIFIVPKAKKLPAWTYMTYIFTKPTWAILLASVIFFIIIHNVLSKAESNIHGDSTGTLSNLTMYSLEIFAATLGSGIREPPGLLRRTLILSWILFSFIFSSSFQSIFTSYLVRPVFEKQVKDFQDIADAEYTIVSTFVARFMMLYNSDAASKIIVQRWQEATYAEGNDVVQRMIDTRNICTTTVLPKIQYAIVNGRFVNKDKTLQIYIAKEINTFYNWIVMQRGFPMKSEMNRFITVIDESGLINKFRSNITIPKQKPPTETGYVPIKIDNILVAFFMFVVGIILACLIFLVEIGLSTLAQ